MDVVNQIEGLLFDVVSKIQAWELMEETIVTYCLRSIGLSMDMIQSDQLSIYKWGREDLLGYPGTFPLPVACRVLISLLDYVLRRMEIQKEEKLEGFALNLMWDLSNLAVRTLMQSPEVRAISISLLFPTIFKCLNTFSSIKVVVHDAPYTLSRSCFAKKIWNVCISMFSLGHLERLDAYNVLSLYFSSFYMIKLKENTEGGSICKEFDLRAEREFWKEIQRGLVDKDPCLRKLALHILKVSFNNYSFSSHSNCHYLSSTSKFVAADSVEHTTSCNGTSLLANITKRGKWAEEEAKSLGVGEVLHPDDGYLSSQERWKVFLLLYEMLEEYGTHLVEAAWTHQISLLYQSWSLNNCINEVSHEVYKVQMETIEGIFSWLAVLWERGFFHENPQVRCLVMQSFLNTDWKEYGTCALKVPRSFILGPLIFGLNDVVHHKDFGVKGVYTSKVIEDATHFFYEYSCQFSQSERADFVWSLASVAKKESFGRAGLMALAFCIASAACQCDTQNGRGKHYTASEFSGESSQEVTPSRASDLLDALGFVIERSKQHFNPNYRLQVSEQVIKAAASLININYVSLELFLHFLSAVPREFTDCGGQLRELVLCWLTQRNEGSILGSFNVEDLTVKNLVSFPMSFLKQKYSPKEPLSFDDEDLDAWKIEAQRWARVLFLILEEAQAFEPILMTKPNRDGDVAVVGRWRDVLVLPEGSSSVAGGSERERER
ncbi:uncharacterized protein LOC109838846 [Asparagus officinalis]|uniref:uncharacterized protein LOC109838846 n=1 Tax=Asparagus officinalis TaxID=4686 RepID=UPI00098E2C46|nr:uncharacterized protein LOC109838846 [Asparagus officinalis]